jgi:putative thiamine transport system substrate-binding protein
MSALLEWAKKKPGRFTFPQPPDFLGSSFLKQALYELTPDPTVLARPVKETDYEVATASLWKFMEDLTPLLWRGGRAYPQNGRRQIQLMADGEIDLAISFSPSEASSAIANLELPKSVRTYVPDGGSIGNASFVAIPYNARAKAGAMVVANFVLSPIAQARKQDPEYWGSGTVLAIDRLDPVDRRRFESIDPGVATLPPSALGRALPEPHPSWVVQIEQGWVDRFGITN